VGGQSPIGRQGGNKPPTIPVALLRGLVEATTQRKPEARRLLGVLFYVATTNVADCDLSATKPRSILYCPNRPKNSSIKYFNVSYHTNTSPTSYTITLRLDLLVVRPEKVVASRCDKNITLAKLWTEPGRRLSHFVC
jgi:hypothetical protein